MIQAEKFARKYANYNVKASLANGKWKNQVGRVVGWYRNYNLIIVEINGVNGGIYDGSSKQQVAELMCCGSYSYLYFAPEMLEPLIQSTLIFPDDCDTCGAKGEAECKIDCPNRIN